MFKQIKSFAGAKRAATAIEYALIAGGIAVVIAVAVYTLGDDVAGQFGAASSALEKPE